MKNLSRMPFLKKFRPKRRNNGAMWASLIGIGAVVYGITRGKRNDFGLPIKDAVKSMAPNMNFAGMNNAVKNMAPNINLEGMNNAVKNLVPNMNLDRMDNAALTEFSEELLKSALNNERH
ncbi:MULTISPECIES: hypothetical protein [Neobacillus]|uniref:Uncharacterized protein n=1 Tax=Neobacillus rhizophilus TaxID=2833579 RepID=A0A942UCF5_9BACI|nr:MULTISPECIES: hypothetical protein [Neobacillus]MBS4216123.1 hypothetical protein [Neobacillus rhizophilus]MBU8919884.1 hypothetical protein [Bacillus sp. FJAT-29953]